MRFAAPSWLLGTALGLVVAALSILGAFALIRSMRRFGDQALVAELVTGRPGGRRALKGGLSVLAISLAFVALAKPQYGRGSRIVPATNLDVVLVLDYSKSMYARDIAPSRSIRAKSEVTRLIAELPGARFGAVAFAGQPMAFPLTSDGGAIAQFFRQMSPNDMPEGGTAIGRALEAARELFARDPLAEKHKKVIVLITDGEDLEGDPVAVAESLAESGIAVYVVQVGGRTPEPIPEVNEAGQVVGWRQDDLGKPLTTELSAAGEAQLAKIAEVSRGQIARSGEGRTGIEQITSRLRQLMTEELSERVETIYADVYFYPLSLALLLVLGETFVGETKRRARAAVLPPPPPRRKRTRKRSAARTAPVLSILCFLLSCSEYRENLFKRHSPDVDQAIAALDAGEAGTAVDLLSRYLSTGKCDNGAIGIPARVRDLPNASFDLGLALFRMAEQFGQRFGDDPKGGDSQEAPEDQEQQAKRNSQVDCALRIAQAIALQSGLPAELRARAAYLAGNLNFLRGDYSSAVESYNSALRLVPGLSSKSADTVGLDAAHNRAIALRRVEEEEKKKGDSDQGDGEKNPDAGPDDAGKTPEPKPNDAKQPEPEKDAGKDSDSSQGNSDPKDTKQDEPEKDGPKPDPGAEDAEPPARAEQPQKDQRILDQLEQAPTFQEHDAKNRALGRPRSRMEDK